MRRKLLAGAALLAAGVLAQALLSPALAQSTAPVTPVTPLPLGGGAAAPAAPAPATAGSAAPSSGATTPVTAPQQAQQAPPAQPAQQAQQTQPAPPAQPGQPAQPAQPPQLTPPAQGPAWLPMGHVTVRVLDSITGRSRELSGAVGTALGFESLSITAKGCYARPPTMRADFAAWLDVVDTHPGQKSFSGWFLAKEPAVTTDDNPDYDVRLVACQP